RSRRRAADYAVRAGERAAALLAFEEASCHYEQALRCLGGDRADRKIKAQRRRCDLLLALGETQWRAGDTQSARKTFTEAAAIARLGVRVLARLAVELYYTDQVERRAALGQEALRAAQALGDPAAQLIALYGRFRSVLGPDALDERLAAAEEIIRLGEEIGD